MTRLSRPTLMRIMAVCALGLLLAACGSAVAEEPAPAAPTNTEAAAAAPTDTQAAATATEADAVDEGEDEQDDGGETLLIEISGHSFTPVTVTIKVGTTVNWLHRDGDFSHTVTADDGSFASGLMGENDRFSFTFDTPGTYAYYCEFHGGAGGAGMSGVITVEE